MNNLMINGRDALATWGIRMGDGFINIIDDFPTMKPFIENESRNENGKRIVTKDAKVSSRQINIPFTMEGSNETDFRQKRDLFISELKRGMIEITVPSLSDEKYRLVYLGKGTSYALSRDRSFAKFILKFEEPNPANRKNKPSL